MAIKGNAAKPAITFDRLHVYSFALNQSTDTNANKKIDLVCKMYGKTGEEKVFENEDIRVTIGNFDALMMEMLVASGIAPEDIPATIATARANAASMNIADAFAAFEQGIGLVMKHKGKFDFTNTE